MTNAWGSITYPAHLYNALQNEGLVEGRWADMEAVQTILGDSNLFVGDRPRNRGDYLKRFLLQMGYSASAFAARGKRRPGRHRDMASRAGPRGIKDGAPVSLMFLERYLRGSGQVDLSPEHVNEIVSRSEWQEEVSKEDGSLTLTQIKDTGELRKKRQLNQRKKTTEGAQLSPGELIRSLALALTAETVEFAFPYLLMHRWCWRLLRHLKEAFDPILRQLHSPSYVENESELPFVVGYIFMAASNDEGGKGDILMQTAAGVVNSMVGQGTGAFVLGVMHTIYGLEVEVGTESDSDANGSEEDEE
ncbi:hypothetical protein QQZ08_008325 [Neonectria magnoliae]|uniref:Uncharacterized protein n=1 Tax=Neonectria magnoliae TaxID=2732573 RepID=A0ABR1HV44_9HYPO